MHIKHQEKATTHGGVRTEDFIGVNSSRRACFVELARLAVAASSVCAGSAFALDEPTPRAATGAASAAVSGAASAGAASAGASSKLEKRSVVIAVANQAALVYLPLTVADQLGFFKTEGLDLEVLETPSLVRAQQMASTVGGGADIVSGWVENTLALQAKGQAFTAFVLQGRAPQIMLGVSTKSVPNSRTLME